MSIRGLNSKIMKTLNSKDAVYGIKRALGRTAPLLILFLALYFLMLPKEIEIEVESVELKYPAYHRYDLRSEVRNGRTFLILKDVSYSDTVLITFGAILLFSICYGLIDPREEFAKERSQLEKSTKSNKPLLDNPPPAPNRIDPPD
ncbi:MAG: hypothetical protein EA425_12350 [Puniceicoccaceae bacterium]|nr:MAG: hypothetical protein EA425_12350 [Puniceicoccaceae bacterium]